jgi:hypothetical protein
MATPKIFNNVIIGQFALTGVPLKVYVNGHVLTITDVEDVEDPNIGLGMDSDGKMRYFNYAHVEKLIVSGNDVTIDTYGAGMEARFGGEEAEAEAPKEDDKESDKLPKESIMNLQDLLKEISKDEVAAEIEGASAQIAAAKAKLKASQAAMKTTVKTSKEKIKAAKSQPIDDGVVQEDHEEFTFGTGDIVKNINPKCKHFKSQGIVKSVDDIEGVGKVATYTVTNSGNTYSPGMSLTKTINQLSSIQATDSLSDGPKYNRGAYNGR